MIEPTTGGKVLVGTAQMPLTDTGGFVAPLFQDIGECLLVQIEAAGVLREENARHADSGWIASGKKGGAGWRTHRICGIQISEADTLLSEVVDVRSADVRAVAAEVTVTEIVAEDEHDVRCCLGSSR